MNTDQYIKNEEYTATCEVCGLTVFSREDKEGDLVFSCGGHWVSCVPASERERLGYGGKPTSAEESE